MEGRVKGYSRPFARNSRAAVLAAAVAAPYGGKGASATPGPSSSTTATSASGSSDVKPNVPPPPRPNPNAPSASTAAPPAPPVVAQEYSVRVPKVSTKPISIMRFNGALGVDPSKWTSLKMAREDNAKHHKTQVVHEEDTMPKFGAGSEYGREAREEARRRKYGGGNKKKYNIEEQPWIMKTSEKNKKYRGVKEGGVSENASYYIFTQAIDGAFEVFPISHWYNFTPIQRYKSLTAEEAEEQFGRRNKIYNYFSVMVRKRLKADDDHDEDGEKLPSGKSTKKKKAGSGLKVSEMEDWDDSDNEESEEDSDKDAGDKKQKKKKGGKPKKKKKASDEEAEEDSDDGDEEGRELDYISDTSETESEDEKEKKNDERGVDQEEGLKNLLDSDSDEEENKDKEEKAEDDDEEEGEKKGDGTAKKSEDTKDNKKKPKKKATKANAKSEAAAAAENLSDDDDDTDRLVDELDNAFDAELGNNSGNSRDGTPDVDGIMVGGKRKASSDLSIPLISKKAKLELSPALVQSAASEGITEEAVRRYLLRKPITVTELLQKFKSKKTKIPSQDMVNVIAHLLKKINPVKKTQNQKMYLYLNNKN